MKNRIFWDDICAVDRALFVTSVRVKEWTSIFHDEEDESSTMKAQGTEQRTKSMCIVYECRGSWFFSI